MAVTKDADILRSVVERLRQRIAAGTATWLVKIKAHRGEPLNEEADDEAGKGCLLPAEEKQWDELTSRIMYTWRTTEGAERRSPWGQGVRQAITKRASWTRVALEHHVGYKRWPQRAGASDNQMVMCFTSKLEGGLPSMTRRRSRGGRAPKEESRHIRKRDTKVGV